MKSFDLTPFTSTTQRWTHKEGESSGENEARIRPQTRQPPENLGQPYRKLWTEIDQHGVTVDFLNDRMNQMIAVLDSITLNCTILFEAE